jgi:hypothetical protein
MSEQQAVETEAVPATSPTGDLESVPSSVTTGPSETSGNGLEKPVEPKATESRLVPIELKGVNLFIELRVPAAAAESFEKTQSLVARLREKFGQDALIEELAQVVSGTIEKVSITVPQGAPTPAVSQPQQAQPLQVSIPSTQQDYGVYQVQSTSTPWRGNALRNLDPVSIYKVLYSPEGAQLRNLLTQQDVVMMDAYYRGWHEQQQQKPTPTGQAVSFNDDDIPW